MFYCSASLTLRACRQSMQDDAAIEFVHGVLLPDASSRGALAAREDAAYDAEPASPEAARRTALLGPRCAPAEGDPGALGSHSDRHGSDQPRNSPIEDRF